MRPEAYEASAASKPRRFHPSTLGPDARIWIRHSLLRDGASSCRERTVFPTPEMALALARSITSPGDTSSRLTLSVRSSSSSSSKRVAERAGARF